VIRHDRLLYRTSDEMHRKERLAHTAETDGNHSIGHPVYGECDQCEVRRREGGSNITNIDDDVDDI
jgi:hypothetical protein